MLSDNSLQKNLCHWFRHYGAELQRFLSRKVGVSDAPDLVQDVYLRVLTYPALDEIREPRAFLYRIAGNLAIDHIRKHAHFIVCETDENCDLEATDAEEPYETMHAEECLSQFSQALAELPPDCRDAFLLNRFDGLSHAEIAHYLGVSDKTVQRYIAKAFDHCLSRLDN